MRELIVATVGAIVLIALGLASLNASERERDGQASAAEKGVMAEHPGLNLID